MMDEVKIYDALLTAALVGVAWKALFGRDAFSSTVFFVVYGLLMALAWVQLGAIDVALAEACIGSGLTGALLIGAIRQFEKDPTVHISTKPLYQKAISVSLSILVFLGMAVSIFGLRPSQNLVQPLVAKNLSGSGTSHEVTAVLLNFRAFDTWLELGVLLLASIAAISIHQIYDTARIPAKLLTVQEQPRLVAHTMFPILILIGGILLWFGSHAPGGAFQAGALIGAAGILLQIGGERSILKLTRFHVRFLLALGFIAFIFVSALTTLMNNKVLEYPKSMAGVIILLLEMTATVSIALTLNVMYVCSHPWRKDGH